MAASQPFQEFLGIELHDDRFVVRTTQDHANHSGAVQGGLIATLVDMAMGHAVRAEMQPDQTAATLQLSVTYLNAVAPGETLIATAEVGKRGASVLLLSGSVVTEDGKDVSQAVGTFTITSAK